jgi:hypothetical protein
MSFLPGMSGGFLPSSVQGLTLSVLAEYAESLSADIVIPATAQAGDVAWLFDCMQPNSNAALDTTPSGFTQLVTHTTGLNRVSTSYRILDGDDAGSTVSGIAIPVGSAQIRSKMMLIIRGSAPIASVTPGDWTAEATTGNPASQSVDASASSGANIVLAGFCASSGPGSYTFSPAEDDGVTDVGSVARVAWKIYDTAPQDHTVDMGDQGTINFMSCGYLRLAA